MTVIEKRYYDQDIDSAEGLVTIYTCPASVDYTLLRQYGGYSSWAIYVRFNGTSTDVQFDSSGALTGHRFAWLVLKPGDIIKMSSAGSNNVGVWLSVAEATNESRITGVQAYDPDLDAGEGIVTIYTCPSDVDYAVLRYLVGSGAYNTYLLPSGGSTFQTILQPAVNLGSPLVGHWVLQAGDTVRCGSGGANNIVVWLNIAEVR